jgi:tetratricopeptide (TPR) repeat protein
VFGRLGDVPFTFQANHDEQMRHWTEAARKLPPADSAASLREAQSAAEAALARWPDDAELWEQLGEIKQKEGDYAGAVAAAQHSLDQVPSSAQCWLLYGTLLAQEKKYEDAVAAFKHVFALDPQAIWARHNLASCLEKLGRRAEAVVEFKRALALKPYYGTGWLALGQLYEEMGRTNDAEHCYNTALTNRVNQADDLAALARFCVSRRWFGLAVTNFAAAIELSPSEPGLRMEAGRALLALGRHDEAVQQYQAAVELAPDQAQPHMQVGVELGRLRKPALAEKEFRQALRLNPDLIEARVDLGIALYEQEKLDDALKQFEDVLQRNPKDATARHYAQLLRNRTALPAGRQMPNAGKTVQVVAAGAVQRMGQGNSNGKQADTGHFGVLPRQRRRVGRGRGDCGGGPGGTVHPRQTRTAPTGCRGEEEFHGHRSTSTKQPSCPAIQMKAKNPPPIC